MKNVAKRLSRVAIPLIAVALGMIAWELFQTVPFIIITLIPIWGWLMGLMLGPTLIISFVFSIAIGIIGLIFTAMNKPSTVVGILMCIVPFFFAGVIGPLFTAAGVLVIVSAAMKKE